jgi:hypothetical protein
MTPLHPEDGGLFLGAGIPAVATPTPTTPSSSTPYPTISSICRIACTTCVRARLLVRRQEIWVLASDVRSIVSMIFEKPPTTGGSSFNAPLPRPCSVASTELFVAD